MGLTKRYWTQSYIGWIFGLGTYWSELEVRAYIGQQGLGNGHALPRARIAGGDFFPAAPLACLLVLLLAPLGTGAQWCFTKKTLAVLISLFPNSPRGLLVMALMLVLVPTCTRVGKWLLGAS